VKRLFVLLLLVTAAIPAWANDTMPPAPYAYRQLDDPRLEAKAQALMETLRCLVCQGQSIADSDASMAGDMRNQVRLRIKAGEDPEAIRHWLMERYGDYISYKPVLSETTWPLFALPLGLLRAAAAVFARRFGGKR
jgi:cytochrome c-type biogenesis protein CcmH